MMGSIDLKNQIVTELQEAASVKERTLRACSDIIAAVALRLTEVMKAGRTIFFCGNGGSAADAQHLAAELAGRYLLERRSLPAIALTVNTSNLTAIGNDYGFDKVFARQLEGLARSGDALVGISTSGNSRNVVEAFRAARRIGMLIVALTGAKGGAMAELADYAIRVPSESTPRIQEAHITIGHIVCGIIERELYGTTGQ